LFLNIIMIMPASQNRSNCAFRCGLLHLATKPTAEPGFKPQEKAHYIYQISLFMSINMKNDITNPRICSSHLLRLV